MEFDSIRPVVSGLLGGVIAIWVGSYTMRYLPREWAGKSAAVLHAGSRRVRTSAMLSGSPPRFEEASSGKYKRRD